MMMNSLSLATGRVSVVPSTEQNDGSEGGQQQQHHQQAFFETRMFDTSLSGPTDTAPTTTTTAAAAADTASSTTQDNQRSFSVGTTKTTSLASQEADEEQPSSPPPSPPPQQKRQPNPRSNLAPYCHASDTSAGGCTSGLPRDNPEDAILWHDRTVKYRQWLYDRVDGTSRYNGSWGRPPCAICYVPVPVRWLPDWIEMNSLFEWFGRIGCVNPEEPRVRFYLFAVALCCNFASLALTFFAALAITHENFDLLRISSFTRGRVRLNQQQGTPLPDAWDVTQIDIGLRTVAVTDPRSDPPDFIRHFSDFCDEFADGPDSFFMKPDDCQACSDASFPIIFSLVISMVFAWPSITTNFLRMWPNYDVNCQKFFGAVVGTISLLSSCYSWFGYTKDCFDNFDQGLLILAGVNVTYDATTAATMVDLSNLAPPDSSMVVTADNEHEFLFVDRTWSSGLGLICVVVATLLRGIDSLCNWMVPTPSITRDHQEQRAYEFLSRQDRSMSVFDRLHKKHRDQEVHTGMALERKAGPHKSMVRLHRLLGIPEPSRSLKSSQASNNGAATVGGNDEGQQHDLEMLERIKE